MKHMLILSADERKNNKRQGLFLLKNSFPEGKSTAKAKAKQHSEFIFHMWHKLVKWAKGEEKKTFICLVTAVFLDYVPYEHWKIRV